MKALLLLRLFVLLLACATIVQNSTAQQQAEDKAAADGKHLGTWRLVATKYGDATEFTGYSKSSKRLKLINATHFNWLEVVGQKVASSAGGSYKLDGASYTETVEFAGEGMESFVGKPQKFTIKLEGDKLHQVGELSSGLKIEEKWERVKE